MNCRSKNLEEFLDFGNQPNGNYYPSYKELGTETIFPFAMVVCKDCWQVQIKEFPPVEMMFSNHPYITGVNMPVLTHFENMSDTVISKYRIQKNSLVLDIGANDGSLLEIFRRKGMRTLGVDPGERTGELAREKGITLCKTFWSHESAKSFKHLNIFPDLITATAVFYHMANIHDFVKGLAEIMTPKTIFLTQCVYLKDVILKGQFDHFYHEHTMIHSLTPLKRLLEEYGLRMLDVDFYPIHGGSFVLYVGKNDSVYPISPSVQKALNAEDECGLFRLNTYSDFKTRVEKNRKCLLELLNKLTTEGKIIFGLGAPLKGSTLLNYYNIGPNLVECATEVNRFKIGKFTPGTHIPIIFEGSIERQPDYYLILSWNFIDFFINKYENYLRDGGKFIVPHPEVKIIGKEVLA